MSRILKSLLGLTFVALFALLAIAPVQQVSAAHQTGDLTFHWKDKDTVVMFEGYGGKSYDFKRQAGGNKDFINFTTKVDFSNNGCEKERGISFVLKTDLYDKSIENKTPVKIDTGNHAAPGNKTCDLSNVLVDHLRSGNATIAFTPTTDTGSFTPPATPTAPTTPKDTCENGSGELRWIMCPVILGLETALNWVDSRIQELLTIDEGYYNNDGIKDASSNIRDIAYIILVPIMLVMVISTAIGFDVISAYTIKRALPRLFAAVIFITLSYSVCVFLIEFFNAVGNGTLGLITSPFSQTIPALDAAGKPILDAAGNPTTVRVGTLTLSSLFGGSILTSAAAAPVAGIGVLIILWLFGGTLLLFAGVAFLVLMLRQMFIVALLLAAPMAILAWIFPGNDKLWKIWWGSFSKLLMMFPIIMALIGVGRIFAFVIHASNPAGLDGAVLQPLMTLVAYMIPYAFIPATFKLAGGAFATLAGITNDKSRGLFDRQRERRKKKLGNVAERTQHGRLFKGGDETNRRGWINKKLQTASLAKEAGFSLNRQTRSDRIESARGAHGFDASSKFLQESHEAKALTGDDDKYRAALEGGTDIEAIKRSLLRSAPSRFAGADKEGALSMAAQDVLRFNKAGGAEVGRIAAIRGLGTASTSWKNTTHYKKNADGTDMLDENGEKVVDHIDYDASGKMLQEINSVAGNNRGLSTRLLAEVRDSQVRAGRLDTGAASYAETAREMDSLYFDKNYTVEQATAGVTKAWTRGKSAIETFGGKRANAEAAAPTVFSNFLESLQSSDPSKIAAGVATVAAAQDIAGQLAPENVDIVATEVLGRKIKMSEISPEAREMFKTVDDNGIEHYPTEITGQEAIEAMRSNADFNTRRREYGVVGRAAAQAEAARVATAQTGQLVQPPPGGFAGPTPPAGGMGGGGFPRP